MILHQNYTDELYQQAVAECLTKGSRYGAIHHHFARLIIHKCFDVLDKDSEQVYDTDFEMARMALHDYWSE